MKKFDTYLVCLSLLFWSYSLSAQESAGGQPAGLVPNVQQLLAQRNASTMVLPALDRQQLAREDAEGPGIRFAAPIQTAFRPDNSGIWVDLPNGDRLWQLKLKSTGALALAALYDDFYLPLGARLYMYSPDGSQIRGAYTDRNNTRTHRFMTGLIHGEEAIIEYYEPAAVQGQGHFRIFRIDHAYRADNMVTPPGGGGSRTNAFGFESSFSCHQNVHCDLGDGMEDQARGICRIIVVVAEGMGYCTGNLVNNTRNDGTPYIYSGFHCMDGYTPLYDLWRFDFNYESESCVQPTMEPGYDSVLGSAFRAGRQQNDFLLVEAIEAIPLSYDAYFLGWDRTTEPPDSSVIIHHPRGDIKKVAVSTSSATVFNGPITWNNDVVTPAQHHFNVNYTEGSFEVGSSGAALFNPAGKMVGHLHGGNPVNCDQTQGYFGRLSLAWTGGDTPSTRLKDWLDPDGLDPDKLNGMNQAGSGSVTGLITNTDMEPVANVSVTVYAGTDTVNAITGMDGQYNLDGFSVGENFSISLSKTNNTSNGVTISDLIIIRKHILGVELLNDPYKMLAADVNGSGNISTLDIIQIQRIILTLDLVFSSVDSWRFLPADFSFADPSDPFDPDLPFTVTGATIEAITEMDFVGIKSGDVNGTANPQN